MIARFLKKIFSNDKEYSKDNLEEIKTDKKIKIAITAILLEAIAADDNLSSNELSLVFELLNDRFSINDSQIKDLIELSGKLRNDHPDIWYFTNIINEHLDKESKYELMEMVWRAIYSDSSVHKYESSLSHKLRGLLHIEHSKFIEIKLKVQSEINP